MSALSAAITKQQVKALQALIEAGCAVVVFTPEELKGVNPKTIERRLAQEGARLIEKEKRT